MIFSKSFGYAIRGILYLAMQEDDKKKVQLDKIAAVLNVPRFFLGKIMKRLVKERIIDSVKGHKGGFCINEKTMSVSLSTLSQVTGDNLQFNLCVLQLRECNQINPCPFHHHIADLRDNWHSLLERTTVRDLLNKDQEFFLKSISIL